MHIKTYDDDGSRAEAIAVLPPRCTVESDDGAHWYWQCDCGHDHYEDEAQVDGILICDSCGRRYVDNDG